MFAECNKHYPSRFGQTSLATAVTNFTKPRTSHFFYLCIANYVVATKKVVSLSPWIALVHPLGHRALLTSRV